MTDVRASLASEPPATLDALLVAMRRSDPSLGRWDDLPTFGGEALENTAFVWSWDTERMIVGSCADDVEIAPTTWKS